MNYLSPYDKVDEQLTQSQRSSSRVSSRSASPRRRKRSRANSLTLSQDNGEQPTSTPTATPSLTLRERPPRPSQLNEIFRPRCNTDPTRSRYQSSGSSNNNNGKKPTATRSVLGSLLRQTLKVTTASVGLSASDER